MTHFTDTILKNMDDSKITGVVFVDLSKGFDTVDHNLLLGKLKSLGFSDHVDWIRSGWIRSYLSDRSQVTRVDNKYSSFKHISIGVPQGSVLGPLLFKGRMQHPT